MKNSRAATPNQQLQACLWALWPGADGSFTGALTAVELTAVAAPAPVFISAGHAPQIKLTTLQPNPCPERALVPEAKAGQCLECPPLKIGQSQLSSHSDSGKALHRDDLTNYNSGLLICLTKRRGWVELGANPLERRLQ